MKLLPCPFCGEDGEIITEFHQYAVMCSCDCMVVTHFYDDKDQAIKEWNTRLGKDRTPK